MNHAPDFAAGDAMEIQKELALVLVTIKIREQVSDKSEGSKHDLNYLNISRKLPI